MLFTVKLKSYVSNIVAIITMIVCIACMGCYRRQEFKEVEVHPEVVDKYLADKPESLRPYYSRILKEGKRNLVLNNMSLGLRALEDGYWQHAEGAFDQALLGIEAVYANSETATKARSIYYEEGMKDFKGEPYERCMAYYYRGLLYMQRGDYENARACFKAGVLQDAFAEEKQYRCDFVLLIFLEGWASQQLGDMEDAAICYQEVRSYRPDFNSPSPEDNVLIIAETGTSPRKLADGVGHAELKFRRGKNFIEKRAAAIIDSSKEIELYPLEDVAWQAMTRGGRAVDKILQGQVEFRKSNEQMGTVLTDVSSTAMISAPLWSDVGAAQAVSGSIGLIGALQMSSAAQARPHADTRYWDNLPDAVHIVTTKRRQGSMKIHVLFEELTGEMVPGLDKKRVLNIDNKEPALLWVRSRINRFSRRK
jgi:tetratricopeptide (TPR) repeat protein